MLHLLNSYDCRICRQGRAAVDLLLAAKERERQRQKLQGTQQASAASASLQVQRSQTAQAAAAVAAVAAVEPLGSLQSWQVDASGTQLTRITAVWCVHEMWWCQWCHVILHAFPLMMCGRAWICGLVWLVCGSVRAKGRSGWLNFESNLRIRDVTAVRYVQLHKESVFATSYISYVTLAASGIVQAPPCDSGFPKNPKVYRTYFPQCYPQTPIRVPLAMHLHTLARNCCCLGFKAPAAKICQLYSSYCTIAQCKRAASLKKTWKNSPVQNE